MFGLAVIRVRLRAREMQEMERESDSNPLIPWRSIINSGSYTARDLNKVVIYIVLFLHFLIFLKSVRIRESSSY